MIVLRSAVFNALFFGGTLVLTLVAMVVRVVSRGLVLKVAMFWARYLVAAARIVCGIRLDVQGLEHIPPGPALIASRHQSAFDTFIWLTLLPNCCYVFKQELRRIPLFGPLIGTAGMIEVDRTAGSAAIRSLLAQTDRAVREGRQIVIFPEGTRSEPGSPVVMQSGIAAMASRTGLPVIPVATDSGWCWGRRSFRKRPGIIRIVVGQPIPARTERRTLMRTLEQGLSAIDRQEKDVADKPVENSVQSSTT